MAQTTQIHRPSGQITNLPTGFSGIMVWHIFTWGTLGPLIHVDTSLITTAYLNIATNHVQSFQSIMFPYGDGHF